MKLKKPCLEWQGYRQPNGYGRRKYKGTPWLVHRATWDEEVGPIPDGMFVLHRCDNPACYEITHLFLGTHEDNMADMRSKGREYHAGASETNAHAVLSLADVVSIRARHEAGTTIRDIADEYGVSQQIVYRVVTRRTWASV